MHQQGRLHRIEAELPLTFGGVRIVHNIWHEPIDVTGTSSDHHLELALLPSSKTAQACFSDDWGENRFEPFGDIFLLPANHRVRARSECRKQHSVICRFSPDAVANWFERHLTWTDRRLQNTLNIGNPKLRHLLVTMAEEIRNPRFASETMVELLACQAVIEVSRHLTGITEQSAPRGLAPWRLMLIDERLADLTHPPSLGELAQLCGLSVRHLARGFLASRGCSLGSYIAEQRLHHARHLLSTGMSIKAVAYSTGFSSPSNFSAAFRRDTGLSPRAWRQQATRDHSRGIKSGAIPSVNHH
jgi:AraC family transcriptional regulator